MIEKLNKHKHLVTLFVSVLLLISLNFNTFAAETKVVSFNNCEFISSYNPTSGGSTDITDVTVRTYSQQSVGNQTMYCTTFKFPTVYSSFRKSILCNPVLNLYTNTRYNFDVYVRVGSSSGTCSVLVQLWFANSQNEAVDAFTIYDNENVSTSYWQHINADFTTTNVSGSTKCIMVFIIASNYKTDTFIVSDMNIKNIDPIATGKPIETPSDDELKNAIDNYDDVMSQLPSINGDELDNIMNFDFSAFTDGMSFVRELFERVMSTFGFNSILVLALTIGLATYIIGRKVG